jgi:Mce-associated membrane protein
VKLKTDSATDRNGATVDPNSLGAESETEHLTDVDDNSVETSDQSESKNSEGVKRGRLKRFSWPQLLAYGVLPGLVLLLTLAAGFLKWQDSNFHSTAVARIESVAAAKESTIALLSYKPGTVEKDLGAARDRLTGSFKESYTQLTRDVVIPGAKQKHIAATATVPAAASVSASPSHAVALVFVNQTTIVGTDAPTDTASSVRVTLDKIAGRWLISGFDPV